MRRLLYVAALAMLTMLVLAPAALAQNVFNCDDYASQADAQANLRANPDDPNGLDGSPGEATSGIPGVACEDTPYPAGSPRDEVPVGQQPMMEQTQPMKAEPKMEQPKMESTTPKEMPKTGGPAGSAFLFPALVVGSGLLALGILRRPR